VRERLPDHWSASELCAGPHRSGQVDRLEAAASVRPRPGGVNVGGPG
jgi:hypothetical protein